MALNVGQDFKKRWLNTPEAIRQTYQEDLARICDLLQPQTSIQTWKFDEERLNKFRNSVLNKPMLISKQN